VDYAAEGLQRISRLGTVIPQERGPDLDEFFLTFERLGSTDNAVAYVEPFPETLPPPPDTPIADQDPPGGIRDFAEINATMSKVTGIPTSHMNVQAVYDRVYQAMPVQPKIAGFISSQQMGITQLAFEYCSTLVDDTTGIRDAFWPGFPFGATEATAFSVANRALLIDPLVEQVVGLNLPTQPVPGDVELELNALLDRLIASPGENTNAIAKGTCAAALGSAAMLVQ
jgi:hypothetical protein